MRRTLPALQQPCAQERPKIVETRKVQHKEPIQCHSAFFATNSANETVLVSASGFQYRFVEVIKRSIFGQVVRAEVMSLTSSQYLHSPLRSRGGSISTYTSEDDNLDLSMDEDYLEVDNLPSPLNRSLSNEGGKFVAIKIYSRSRMNSSFSNECKEDPCTELEISHFLSTRHAHLMGSLECCANEDYLFNVMPFAPHPELFDYLAENQRFSEDKAKATIKQVLFALKFLHGNHIAHRDISLENILYDPVKQHATLIDFGLGVIARSDNKSDNDDNDKKRHFSSTSSSSRLVPNIFTGKVSYLPPEIVVGQKMIDPFAADVWAVGICLVYLILGFPPLVQAHPSDMRFGYLQSGRLAELIDLWQVSMSDSTLEFVEFLLEVDPSKRPTIDDIFAHPWMM